MQPYQKAAEALRSGEEYPLHLLKNAGLTALGGGVAAAGSKALGKIVPAVGALINKYVPNNIMEVGLTKINPRFAKFMEGAKQAGYSDDDLRNYLGEKIEKHQEQEKQKGNIIEQESPELHSFLDQEIRKGRKPIQAGAIAQNDKRFSDVIKKLMKAHKTPWSSIIESVFGTGEIAQPSQNSQQNSTGLAGIGGIASGMMDNFYDQAFDSLKKGSMVMSGVRDPLLQAAKSAFDAGQIKSPQDLKQFAQQRKSGQGLDPGVAQILQQGSELLKRFRGPQ